MKKEEFESKMNSIQEKIGQEATSLILDEIGLLITDNQTMNSELDKKDEQITKLQQDKETLQRVNGNLLQQISMGDDIEENKKLEEEKPKDFDFRTVFDEKRKF